MKRPSTWPLLVILLVVGVVFTALVFHDRIKQAEDKVASVEQTFQTQNNQIQELAQQLESAVAQLKKLDDRLEPLDKTLITQGEQLQTLNEQVQVLSETPTTTAAPSELPQTALWAVAVSALVLVMFEFILQ